MTSHLTRSAWQSVPDADQLSTITTRARRNKRFCGGGGQLAERRLNSESPDRTPPSPASDADLDTKHQRPYEFRFARRRPSRGDTDTSQVINSATGSALYSPKTNDESEQNLAIITIANSDDGTGESIEDSTREIDQDIVEDLLAKSNLNDSEHQVFGLLRHQQQQRRHSSVMCDELENACDDEANPSQQSIVSNDCEMSHHDFYNHHTHHLHHQMEMNSTLENQNHQHYIPSTSIIGANGFSTDSQHREFDDQTNFDPIWHHQSEGIEHQFAAQSNHPSSIVEPTNEHYQSNCNSDSSTSTCISFQTSCNELTDYPARVMSEHHLDVSSGTGSVIACPAQTQRAGLEGWLNDNQAIMCSQQGEQEYQQRPRENHLPSIGIGDSYHGVETTSVAPVNGENQAVDSNYLQQQQPQEVGFEDGGQIEPTSGKHDLEVYSCFPEYFPHEPALSQTGPQYGSSVIAHIPSSTSDSSFGSIMANFNKFDCGRELIEYQPAFFVDDQQQTDSGCRSTCDQREVGSQPSSQRSLSHVQSGYQFTIHHQYDPSTTTTSTLHSSGNTQHQQKHHYLAGKTPRCSYNDAGENRALRGHQPPNEETNNEPRALTDLDEHCKTYHVLNSRGGGSSNNNYNACIGSGYSTAARYDPDQYGHYSQHGFEQHSVVTSAEDEAYAGSNYAECHTVLYHSLDQENALLPAVSNNYDPAAEISSCLSKNSALIGEHDDSSGGEDVASEAAASDEDDEVPNEDAATRTLKERASTRSSARQKRKASVRRRSGTLVPMKAGSSDCNGPVNVTNNGKTGSGHSNTSTNNQQSEKRNPGCRPETIERLRNFLLRRRNPDAAIRQVASSRFVADNGSHHVVKMTQSPTIAGRTSMLIETVKIDEIPTHSRPSELARLDSSCSNDMSDSKSEDRPNTKSSSPNSSPSCSYTPYMQTPISSGVLTRASRRLIERSAVCT